MGQREISNFILAVNTESTAKIFLVKPTHVDLFFFSAQTLAALRMSSSLSSWAQDEQIEDIGKILQSADLSSTRLKPITNLKGIDYIYTDETSTRGSGVVPSKGFA